MTARERTELNARLALMRGKHYDSTYYTTSAPERRAMTELDVERGRRKSKPSGGKR